jgi:hypothetical protein
LERFLSYAKIFGTASTFAVAVALAFNWWGVWNLSKIPYAHAIDILYVYLILDTLAALKLLRGKRPEIDKLCPRCDSALQSKPHYICPKCGELHFNKGDKNGNGEESVSP